MFIDPSKSTFASDIWSLAATLFHLVSKDLPFECSTPIIASVNITDMTKPAPDVREKAPPAIRDQISPLFAGAIARGLQKDLDKRYHSTDEMCLAFHRCLVQQKKGVYSVYISYNHSAASGDAASHEKVCAALLYDALNNTVTGSGNRVFACMRPLGLKSEDDWEGFAAGFQNSLIAIPVLSSSTIQHLESLKGSKDDEVDIFLMELLLMQPLLQQKHLKSLAFRKIIPFFLKTSQDLNALSSQRLVPRESFPSKLAAAKFLKASAEDADVILADSSVRTTVDSVLKAGDALKMKMEMAVFQTSSSFSSPDDADDPNAKDKDHSQESGEDSEIIQTLCKLGIVKEESLGGVLSWKKEIKKFVADIYDEIDQASP